MISKSNFKIETTHLKDSLLLTSDHFADERGIFFESYNHGNLLGCGLPDTFPQDNICYSKKNTLRGLHIQKINPQGKLIRVLSGRILDVIVDLRSNSYSFKKWGAFELHAMNYKSLWVPPGFAHGYYCYEDSIILYKCSTLYDKQSDSGIIYNDSDLSIDWPSDQVIISSKDKKLPTMESFLKDFIYG